MDFETMLMESLYENSIGDIIGTGANMLTAMGIVSVFAAIVSVFCFVISIAFTGAMLIRLSHKLNVFEKEALAYIPFVRDFYRMRMAGFHPALGLCLKETGMAVTAIIALLVNLIFKNLVVYVIFLIAGLVVNYYFNYKYYNKMLKHFGFEGALALLVFIPGLSIALDVIGMITAFSDKFESRAVQNLTSRINSTEERIARLEKFHTVPARRKAMVYGNKGKYAGSKFEIADGESITLGRDAQICNIVYDDKYTGVSRNHCTIRYSAGENGFYVTDNSSNGTYIGGTLKIGQGNTKKVEMGTVICLGDANNSFKLG